MFCAPGLVSGGTEGVGFRFHVLRARTHFRQYRGRLVPFSCFALSGSFSAVPSASGPVFIFYAPGLFFGSTEGVGSLFHVLRARTCFRRYRRRRAPFSGFTRPDSFSAVERASGPIFMFCAPGLVFGGTEVVGSRFHVLCSKTCFWRRRMRRVSFSCFARPDTFLAVPRASGPVFMFCPPGIVFGVSEGVGSSCHFSARGLVFGGSECVLVPFSCFALLDSFSVVPKS
jgi:hypothetical protein